MKMYHNYLVSFSFKGETGKRHLMSDRVAFPDNAQNAVDVIREEYGDLRELRIEEVYKENRNSWSYCNDWE